MLEKLRCMDHDRGFHIEAYTDGYAYDSYCNLYLLSVGGHDSAVKAVTSALVSGKEIEVQSEYPVFLKTGFAQKYRILANKLECGLLHQVLMDENFFKSQHADGGKLLLIDDDREAHDIVYHAVESSYSVPAIQEWSEWLYKKMDEDNCLNRLLGPKKVLIINAGEEQLDSIITEGIKTHEIDF